MSIPRLAVAAFAVALATGLAVPAHAAILPTTPEPRQTYVAIMDNDSGQALSDDFYYDAVGAAEQYWIKHSNGRIFSFEIAGMEHYTSAVVGSGPCSISDGIGDDGRIGPNDLWAEARALFPQLGKTGALPNSATLVVAVAHPCNTNGIEAWGERYGNSVWVNFDAEIGSSTGAADAAQALTTAMGDNFGANPDGSFSPGPLPAPKIMRSSGHKLLTKTVMDIRKGTVNRWLGVASSLTPELNYAQSMAGYGDTYDVSPLQVRYQWLKDGHPIQGQTKASIQPWELTYSKYKTVCGHFLSVRVTVANPAQNFLRTTTSKSVKIAKAAIGCK